MRNLVDVSPYRQAAEQMRKANGLETDRDLLTYNQLTQENFKALQRRYGFEDVRRYITYMESKKLGL